VTPQVSLATGITRPPAEVHDVALLDLDGVVYVGPAPVPGVPDALARARQAGMRLGFVTNNASRSPDDVAAHLSAIGVPAEGADVITSSQAAATVVRATFGAGAKVLPVGGPGVPAALAAAGLTVVGRAEEEPVAVVQGFGPHVAWAELSEAVVAIRKGARHVATNGDTTIPSPRGRLPGNGALVAVVSGVTGEPPTITGKPDPAMHAECVRRTGAQRPLVVGDRLDTDIEGARRAGAPSLLVLTGVTDPATLLAAGPGQRPDLLAADAGGLLTVHPPVRLEGWAWVCGAWAVAPADSGDAVVLRSAGEPAGDDDGLDWLRALCVAHWSRHADAGADAAVVAADGAAAAVLDRWQLGAG
jgi:HAD superfamily hydrolase (TIGR01450 family)